MTRISAIGIALLCILCVTSCGLKSRQTTTESSSETGYSPVTTTWRPAWAKREHPDGLPKKWWLCLRKVLKSRMIFNFLLKGKGPVQ